MKELSLGGNKIRNLNRNWFSSLQNLEKLGLNENMIADLPQNIFSSLTNLQELFLHRNQLTVIHSDSFGNLKKLSKIHLYSNKINEIDEKLIDKLPLSILDLRYNNVCENEWINDKNEMKTKLKKCFENYQPRVSKGESNYEGFI